MSIRKRAKSLEPVASERGIWTSTRSMPVPKPSLVSLTTTGVPIGSPGMESGTRRDAYDVLLVLRDGTAKTFNHYPARS